MNIKYRIVYSGVKIPYHLHGIVGIAHICDTDEHVRYGYPFFRISTTIQTFGLKREERVEG
jgi:hypothetical protein